MNLRIRLISTTALALAAFIGPSAAHAVAPHHTLVRVNANESSNWAGYNQGALDHALFHSVGGDWIVPTATAHKSGEAESSSAWIGIGGGCSTDNCATPDLTLIQTGTNSDVSSSGAASYGAWWEIIPGPQINVTTVHPQPGDQMHADITESLPGLWAITLRNVSKSLTFTTTVPYTSTYGSAEWILETPITANSLGVATMPKLTPTKFFNAKANGLPANLSATQQFQLVDGAGTRIATPSSPTGGTSFNVCTYATTCAAP